MRVSSRQCLVDSNARIKVNLFFVGTFACYCRIFNTSAILCHKQNVTYTLFVYRSVRIKAFILCNMSLNSAMRVNFMPQMTQGTGMGHPFMLI